MINKFVSIVLGVLFFLGFIVVGPIVYFTGFSKLLWLFFFAGTAVFMVAVCSGNRFLLVSTFSSPPAFLLALLAFLFFLVFGFFSGTSTFGEMVMSSRWYFFVWPLMLIFLSGLVGKKLIDYLWRFLLVVALIQLPVAVAQYFFIALPSERPSPWDAIVGTFPGSVMGGGQSAAMGVFTAIVMLLAYALWRTNKISRNRFFLQVFCGVFTLAFSEVKAAVLSLPLLLLLYYGRDFLKRPLEAFLSIMTATSLVVILFWGYGVLHYSYQKNPISEPSRKTALERIERVFSLLDEDVIYTEKQDQPLGRIAHLIFWAKENLKSGNTQLALLGYGAGSTQVSQVWRGEVAELYRYPMGISSSAILLWETGLLGHLLFVFVLLLASRDSLRLSRNKSIPDVNRVFLYVGAVALVFFVVTLPYKNFAFRSVPIQLFMVLLFGQILYWRQSSIMELSRA
ncbi:hypothetical protein [Porticoccus sp.]